MAITQISKIQVRTGNSADLPVLSSGEFGYATDTHKLYIGNPGASLPTDNTEIGASGYSGVSLYIRGTVANYTLLPSGAALGDLYIVLSAGGGYQQYDGAFSNGAGTWTNIGPIQGPTGYSGYSGVSGHSGVSGTSGISGFSGISGISGYSGLPGPSTIINATNDVHTAPLYPVMVGAAGSNQTAKATTTKLSFNASTGALSTKYLLESVQTGITAAGTDQLTATALASTINVISTTALGTGVKMPAAVAGMKIYVINNGANSLAVYPNTGASINSGAANVAFNQVSGATLHYIAISSTQWYTVGATYA